MEAAILFGKYELLERINVGGMAEIVKARDSRAENGPLVAVKRILPHLVDDGQFVAMFLDESRMLSSLNHEHIIRTLDVGMVDGTPYLALELVDGKDARMLFHRMRRHGFKLPLPIACYIMARVCDGLHYAHEHVDPDGQPMGLVHRDVSLQNILLSYAGDVKVTDFGIAMSVNNLAHTQTGVVKGKFGYMSPEQLRGKSLDRRTDVFSAGICLYELLTGHRLFSSETDYESMVRVRNVDIVPPRDVNPEISEELEAIVLRALAKNAEDRFPNAGELSEALQAFTVRNDCEVIAEDLGACLKEAFSGEEEPAALQGARGDWRSAEEATGLGAFTDLQGASELTSFPYVEDVPAPLAPSLPVGALGGAAAVVGNWRGAGGVHVGGAVAAGHTTGRPGTAASESGTPAASASVVSAADVAEDDITCQLPAARGEALVAATELSAIEGEGEPSPVTEPLVNDEPVAQPKAVAAAPMLHGVRDSRPAGGIERGPRRFGAWLTVAGLMAVLATAAYVGLGPGSVPATASIHLVTEPVDVRVAVDGLPIAASASPFLVQDLEASKPHRIEVTKPGYRPWLATLTVAPGAVLQVPLVRLARNSDAGAAAPPKAPAQAAAVAVPAAEPAATPTPAPEPTAEVAVAEEPGELRLTAPPGQVFIDGVAVGRTPGLKIAIAAGRHRVRWIGDEGQENRSFGLRVPSGRIVYRHVDPDEAEEASDQTVAGN